MRSKLLDSSTLLTSPAPQWCLGWRWRRSRSTTRRVSSSSSCLSRLVIACGLFRSTSSAFFVGPQPTVHNWFLTSFSNENSLVITAHNCCCYHIYLAFYGILCTPLCGKLQGLQGGAQVECGLASRCVGIEGVCPSNVSFNWPIAVIRKGFYNDLNGLFSEFLEN